MSRKLATTIKDSAIPGKYKRVLEAYAAFANNDGTNIRPSQQQLGKKAGTSRWTFSRNTAALIESGILRRAQSHTCKVAACNKGTTHFTGTWGRYTLVYEIDISLLQNAERYLGAKQQKVNGAKCRKVMGANCYTTQALKENSGTQPNSSASHEAVINLLTDQLTESQAEPEEDQNLSGLEAKKDQQQDQPQKPDWDLDWFLAQPDSPAKTLLREFYPSALTDKLVNEQWASCTFLTIMPWGLDGALAMLRWNRIHENGKWKFRSPTQMSNALVTKEQAFKNNYDTHEFFDCPKCKSAGLKHYDTMREIAENLEANARDANLVRQQAGRSRTAAAGKGFDPEEA